MRKAGKLCVEREFYAKCDKNWKMMNFIEQVESGKSTSWNKGFNVHEGISKMINGTLKSYLLVIL